MQPSMSLERTVCMGLHVEFNDRPMWLLRVLIDYSRCLLAATGAD